MKKFSIIAAVVLIIIFTTLYFISNMFYNLALSPDNNKDKVFESSHNAPTKKFDNTKINNDNNKFKEKAEIISVKSFDGLNLKSYKLAKNNTHKWVIINHGYMQKPYQMGHAGMKFYNQGYNVILPHMRGRGE